jgi:hypothetical protein
MVDSDAQGVALGCRIWPLRGAPTDLGKSRAKIRRAVAPSRAEDDPCAALEDGVFAARRTAKLACLENQRIYTTTRSGNPIDNFVRAYAQKQGVTLAG